MEYSLSPMDAKKFCASIAARKLNGSATWKASRMVGIRSASDRTMWALLIIITYLLLSGPIYTQALDVFLSSGEQTALWNGDCDSASACTETSPCSLPFGKTNITGLSPSLLCKMVFSEGSYDGILLSLHSPRNLELYFRGGVVSALSVETPSPVSRNNIAIQGNTTSRSILSGVSFNLTASYVDVSRLEMVNNTALIGDTFGATISHSSFDSTHLHINTVALELQSSTSSPNCDFHLEIVASKWDSGLLSPSLALFDSTLPALRSPITFSGNSPYFPAMICSNSIITTNAPLLIDYTSTLSPSFGFEDCSVSSLLPNAGTTLIAFGRDADSYSLFMLTTTFHNIRIETALDPFTVEFVNSTFIDCPIAYHFFSASSTMKWANVAVTQFQRNLPVVFQSSNAPSRPVLTNVTFSNPLRLPGSHFAISSPDTIDTSDSSVLNISDLHLNVPRLIIGSVEVTQSISSSLQSSTLSGAPQPSSGPPLWVFHSIDIHNVQLDPSEDLILDYIPSEPNKGIKMLGTSNWTRTPSSISVSWPSTLPPPKKYGIYPLVTLPGTYALGERFNLVHQAEYEWDGIFFSPPLLSFLTPNSTEIDTPCEGPIPDGFICAADGTLYSLHSLNTSALDIPGGSGNVLVIGNLTAASIAFSGPGSNLVVTGCLDVGKEIVWDLSKETNLPVGPTTLITQSPSCTKSLSGVTLNVKLPPKTGCKQTKVERSDGNGSAQLSVILRVDDSGCKTKTWIIIVAVVASVVVVLVILAAIFMFAKPARNCLGIAPRSHMNKQAKALR